MIVNMSFVCLFWTIQNPALEKKTAFILDAVVSGLADKAGVSAEQTANMFDGPESHIVWMYDKLKSWQQTQTLANKAFEGINTLAARDGPVPREPT